MRGTDMRGTDMRDAGGPGGGGQGAGGRYEGGPGAADRLARALRGAVRGDVDFGPAARALTTMDASNYRRVPLGVVAPRDTADVAAALRVCAEAGVPVVPRGGGTSIAGQATGTGVVLDFTRHMAAVLELDPGARTAVVQPGVVLDVLRARAAAHGLTFGPDPSTRSRCTLGGMIGNNACGAHSVAWGTTADNVRELEVLRYGGGAPIRLARGWEWPGDGAGRGAGGSASAAAPASAAGAGAGDGAGVGADVGAGAGAAAGSAAGRAGAGSRVAAGSGAGAGAGVPGGLPVDLRDGLRGLVEGNLALLRTGMARPGMTRRISGYAVDALLPERGADLARAFCGSEGTLGVVTEARVALVEVPREPALAVLGYADESAAAEAAAGLLPFGPLTVEGMAADLVRGAPGAALLPRGQAWLFVEMPDAGAARRLARTADAVDTAVVTEPARQRALWRIREDAAGTATRMPDGGEAWPGWEDCAVPPARLGGYLREFRALLAAHGLRGTPYGHFGEGCIHVRIDFDLASAAGVARFRTFSEELADLVAAHGGSLSGEHGDGQARAELLPRMYGAEVVRVFAAYKDLWDPPGGMNPAILTRPARLDENLRFAVLPAAPLTRPRADPPPLVAEPAESAAGPAVPVRPVLPVVATENLVRGVARCVGVAKCRAAEPAGAGVMCPSYRVTGEEMHSTRGRARLLHEMLAGEVVTEGWRSPEVREALDLCLGCKGCRSDCPAGVDMAAYKAEFLHRHWAGRIRPAAHYAMGGLPDWLRLVAAVRGARAANALGRLPGAKRLAGVTPERELPRLAPETFTRWWRRTGRAAGAAGGSAAVSGAASGAGSGAGSAAVSGAARGAARGAVGAGGVLLWPDTFTEHLAPQVGRAAVRVLDAAGIAAALPAGRVCCGLTYVSTGRLDRARKVLRRTLDVVGEAADEGAAVLVLEPSCAAALRTDLPELLPDDPRARRLASAVRTFAQVLEERAPHWQPPRLDRTVAGQTHCHQHAVLGDAAERRLRERAGLTGELAGGCCGLAGNFGFERGAGRYAVSVACAEEQLLPAVRAAGAGTELLADGFSCRTQVAQLTDRRARHLAEVLAEALADGV
ncbi:FAD-binding and (Fe-S)-binding domain-containing protein [Streptomyces sp. NBC_00239]|uniref:FAD-binding and (Fe-S)-binding domain-containing protein n=1 Tax=Streptomyces sp. NBC_00239 TaxID=2903640 RepID=UPI003FA697F5